MSVEDYLIEEIEKEDIFEEAEFTDQQFKKMLDWIKERRLNKLNIKIFARHPETKKSVVLSGIVLKSENFQLYPRTILISASSVKIGDKTYDIDYLLKVQKTKFDLFLNFLRSLNKKTLAKNLEFIAEDIPFLNMEFPKKLQIETYHLRNDYTQDKRNNIVFLKQDLQKALNWINKKSRTYHIEATLDGELQTEEIIFKNVIVKGRVDPPDKNGDIIDIQLENIQKKYFQKKKMKQMKKFSAFPLIEESKIKISGGEKSTFIPNMLYLKITQPRKGKRNLIEVRNLKIAFDERVILENVDFNVLDGAIMGIIGESGSGKSLTVKSLLGEVDYEGDISIMGIDAHKQNKIASFIGYVPEDISLIYEDFTPMENLVHFGRQYNLSEAELSRRAKKILEDIQIPEFMGQEVKFLSGGQKKRVSIAIAMIHEPKILILDEPTSGLDPMMRFELWKFLDFINKEYGITLIVISHYLDEIEYSDKSAVYFRGIGMHDFDSPENLKASLPGKGKALEIQLKEIVPDITDKLGKISEIEEVIQRGKRIRLLSDLESNELKRKIQKFLGKESIPYEKLEENVIVDMVDYFTVKSNQLGDQNGKKSKKKTKSEED